MTTSVRLLLMAMVMPCCTACTNHKAQSSGAGAQGSMPYARSYQSPVDFEIVLAGNFGEPRPWHFHGGIDIKTHNQEGHNIRAIADGYVSRLTVGKYGFGNAVYVCHPDGNTSVYCHLRRFADIYETLIHRTGHCDTIDVRFAPGRLPVRGGDLIAVSGNTGKSTGPHLHLEVHDTRTWAMRDPLRLLGHLVSDTVAPQAHSFMAIPQDGEGLFNGSPLKQTYPLGAPLSSRFTAWGRVGFALWADDYAQGVYHRYGIRHTRLLVDGREVFRADVDSIPISCQTEVNRWGDYQHWRHTHNWYMKSYREPDMRLPILHTGFDRGIVTFSEEREYQICYVLTDYFGNESRYAFTVMGQHAAGVMARCRPTLLNRYLLFDQCLWPVVCRRQ